MKNLTLAVLAATFFIPSFSFATEPELEQNCWEAVQEISRKKSTDLACVVEKAADSFSKLCAVDGIQATKEFRVYLVLRDRYSAAKNEASAWIAANPGATQYSPAIAAKLKNADNAWLVAGKKYQIEGHIEKVRRSTLSCK